MRVTNDSPAGFGDHAWKGGDVVDVDPETAAFLVSLKDAGFRTVADEPTDAETDPGDDAPKPKGRGRGRRITEPDPEPTDAETDPGDDATA